MRFTIMLIVVLSSAYSYYQSFIQLSSIGNEFKPQHPIQVLLVTTSQRQLLCYTACNQQPSCHAFDYDPVSKRCRLFEGDLTTGSIVSSAFVASIVGIILQIPSLYANVHNQSCQVCQENRYQICSTTTNTCQCPPHTFWNGSVCLLQLFNNDTCSQIDSCRADLNLTCVTDSGGQFNRCSTAYTTSTTTLVVPTTTTTRNLASTCSASMSGGTVLGSFSGHAPVNVYQNYTFNFTATSSTTSTLIFSFSSTHNHGWFIDNVSVRDAIYLNSTQLVTNGDFATGNLSGWTQLCSMNCSGPATQGVSNVILSGCGSGSTAPCYYGECDPSTYVFLLQSLATTYGRLYYLFFSMAVNDATATRMIVSIG